MLPGPEVVGTSAESLHYTRTICRVEGDVITHCSSPYTRRPDARCA